MQDLLGLDPINVSAGASVRSNVPVVVDSVVCEVHSLDSGQVVMVAFRQGSYSDTRKLV
jgi:hypothetical protein